MFNIYHMCHVKHCTGQIKQHVFLQKTFILSHIMVKIDIIMRL